MLLVSGWVSAQSYVTYKWESNDGKSFEYISEDKSSVYNFSSDGLEILTHKGEFLYFEFLYEDQGYKTYQGKHDKNVRMYIAPNNHLSHISLLNSDKKFGFVYLRKL